MSSAIEELDEKYYALILKFISSLKNGKLEGSDAIATATVALLEKVINEVEYGNAAEMLAVIRCAGRQLVRALPQEGIVGNMVRRVLRIIREEYHTAGKNPDACQSEASGDSLQKLVRADAARRSLACEKLTDVRAPVIDHIAEFKVEIETSAENIAMQAPEHIHANELILTYGSSSLVEKFLRRAARDRTFHVILAEGPDCRKSHEMVARLARARIECTVVADCAVMGVMSRVNKVIAGTQSVLAGGGLRATAGMHTVALAAQHYSVPVIILSPMYKMCPIHLSSYEQDEFNAFASPESVLPYESGAVVHLTHVYNPLYDYVPPDLVTLFVTNQGGNSPSYIYRMMSELYDPSDYQL